MISNRSVVMLLGFLSLFGIYLSIYCGIGYIAIIFAYLVCAALCYRVSRIGRYLSIFVMAVNLLVNITTIAFVYYPASDARVVDAEDVFLVEFDHARFLLEIIPPTIGCLLGVLLLFVPSVAQKYRHNA